MFLLNIVTIQIQQRYLLIVPKNTFLEMLSVKHIICNCLTYRDIKASFEIDDNFQVALGPNQNITEKIFKFLKLTIFYNLI